MPFSDLKPLTAKYMRQVWQKEWDENVLVSNKRHEILQKLVSGYFELSEPQRITSGLKQTSICPLFTLHTNHQTTNSLKPQNQY